MVKHHDFPTPTPSTDRPSRQARSFFLDLKREGFTNEQILDLSMRLLDEVTAEAAPAR